MGKQIEARVYGETGAGFLGLVVLEDGKPVFSADVTEYLKPVGDNHDIFRSFFNMISQVEDYKMWLFGQDDRPIYAYNGDNHRLMVTWTPEKGYSWEKPHNSVLSSQFVAANSDRIPESVVSGFSLLLR